MLRENPAARDAAADPVLRVVGLRTYFRSAEHQVKAVDGVSLEIGAGETLGLVGESGSGKSVTSLSILRLLPAESARIEAGEIAYLGRDLVRLPGEEMRRIRGKEISMIFQEPGTSLNPVLRVGEQVAETLRVHLRLSRRAARARALELFAEVGIPEPERRIDAYPHELSGGQKQRVMIAIALCCGPRLLIADEPTTALDVTIQAQILNLIRRLRDQRGMAILFISHDFGVIAEIADRVAVMYRGRLVEYGDVLEVFAAPRHPYTRGLLACRPRLDSRFRRLPTVADFMEVREGEDDELEISERPLSGARLDELSQRGRPRLLHPRARLAELGYEPHAGADALDDAATPLLEVADLSVHFPIRRGLLRRRVGEVRAVSGISFDVYPGQTLGLVGESGCGKTTTGLAILRLLTITAGRVRFGGRDITELRGRPLRALRRRMQIILQDPYASLNPRMSIESMLVEVLKIHGIGEGRRERVERAAKLLEEVGLEPDHLRRYPHEFSGGQRQRISVARALAVEPEFIVCDECVSSLDVSVQAQVLNLLLDLQEARGLTYVFISHDLSVVKFMSDMMAVMHDGRFVELGPAESIYERPRQDYTKRLIDAVPDDSLENIRRRQQERTAAQAGGGPP